MIVFMLSLLACEESEPIDPTEAVSSCFTEFSVANGYDHVSDEWGYACVSSTTETKEDDCEGPTPESVSEECAFNGVTCDPNVFITAAAAECLAADYGLDEGLEGYHIWLVFYNGINRPGWNVSNVEHINGPSQSGQNLLFDAETGEMLQASSWSMMP